MTDHPRKTPAARLWAAAFLAGSLLAGCGGHGGGSSFLPTASKDRAVASVAVGQPTFTFVANVRMTNGEGGDRHRDSLSKRDRGLPIFVLASDACFGSQPNGGNGDGHRGGDSSARQTAHRGGWNDEGAYRPEEDTTLSFGPFTLTDPCKPHKERGDDASSRRTTSLAASDGYIIAIDSADPNKPQIVDGPGPFANYTYTFAASAPHTFLGEHSYTFELVTATFPTPSPSPSPTPTPTATPCIATQSSSRQTMITLPKPTPSAVPSGGCPTPTPNPRPTGTATPAPTPTPSPTPTPKAGFMTSYSVAAFSLSDTSEYVAAGAPATSVWFTQKNLAGVYRIGLLDSTTGTATFFTPPHQNITGMALGSDGAAYYAWHDTGLGVFTSGVDKITNAGAITTFSYNQTDASGNFEQIYGLRSDSHGNLWFSGQVLDHNVLSLGNVVGFIVGMVSTGGTFTTYSVPNQPPAGDKISPMADGSLWSFGSDPNNGAVKTYMHVSASGAVTTVNAPDYTTYAAPGPDGNPWFAGHGVMYDVIANLPVAVAFGGGNVFEMQTPGDAALWWDDLSNRVCRINSTTNLSDCYATPQAMAAGALSAGSDGNLWAIDQAGTSIVRVVPGLR